MHKGNMDCFFNWKSKAKKYQQKKLTVNKEERKYIKLRRRLYMIQHIYEK